MKLRMKAGLCAALICASQAYAGTVTGPGGDLTPPGLTSGVVAYATNAASEPGSVIPGGSLPDIPVPAILGYNTQITNITLNTVGHTFAADLDLRLISPGGVIYNFNLDNGGSTGLDMARNMIFDTSAVNCADDWTSSGSAAQPENGLLFETSENNCGPLDTTITFVCAPSPTLEGDEVNGVWTLEVTDDAGGDTGTFAGFSITFDALTPPTVDSGGVPIDPAGCSTVPDPPVLGTVTPGDASFSVEFSPPMDDGGSAILDYAVACDTVAPVVGAGSPIMVGGLTNGTTYSNCAVTARNSAGSSAPSATFSVTPRADQTITNFTATPADGVFGGSSSLSADASSGLPVTFGSSTPGICTVNGSTVDYTAIGLCTVTADQPGSAAVNPAPQVTLDITVGADVPGAPTIDNIVASVGTLTVFFSPPGFDGGAPIDNYLVSCDGFTASGPGSPIALDGLPNGERYSCTVAAENSAGFGPPSAPVETRLAAFPIPTLSVWGLIVLMMGMVLLTQSYFRRM